MRLLAPCQFWVFQLGPADTNCGVQEQSDGKEMRHLLDGLFLLESWLSNDRERLLALWNASSPFSKSVPHLGITTRFSALGISQFSQFTCDFNIAWEIDMATPSCILVWRIPWTEEPGGLQSKGSLRV